MSECKKLRISEIRRGIFIIERYDFGNPGKWVELNIKGEVKQDVFMGDGLIQRLDKSEYKDLKEAEEVMKDFILFPRVVMTNDVKRSPSCYMEEIIFNKDGDRVTLTNCEEDIQILGTIDLKSPVETKKVAPEVELNAAHYDDHMQRMEEILSNIYRLEEELNIISEKINWLPFKISIGRVNENIDNPI